jgi:hypothetical protein
MNNNTQRVGNAFMTVLIMLVIISVGMALIYGIHVLVFPLVLLTTVMVIYLSIIIDNRNRQK